MEPTGDYTADGVPSFEFVRDKIEGRHATAGGATELAGETAPVQDADQRKAELDQAGRDRLEEIRRSLRGE